jgi:hypothetical protein
LLAVLDSCSRSGEGSCGAEASMHGPASADLLSRRAPRLRSVARQLARRAASAAARPESN